MKILVCISKVPDTTTKISFKEDNTRFNDENVQWILNPTDEWYALVRALELKEKLGGTVTVIHVGKADSDPVIRKALALGADDAVRIDAEPADSYFTGAQIAEYARGKGFDIIFTGKETISYNGFMVGGVIAELLQLPFVSLASSLDMEGTTATIRREIEGGKEAVKVSAPFVVSATKGIAEPRIPNMRGIMSAKTKPLAVVQPAEVPQFTFIKSYELPPQRQSVKLVKPENISELVDLLHNEAKII
ncbi:MAG TPA: electron transfer flavoprotein subunit beta/FixA family protein [Chitinophagales bacterium]|nr:electron transfer flavoprotein subunit beta/FixA family protein [Chitinophagales bacterium]